jgi:hypothetical protein
MGTLLAASPNHLRASIFEFVIEFDFFVSRCRDNAGMDATCAGRPARELHRRPVIFTVSATY